MCTKVWTTVTIPVAKCRCLRCPTMCIALAKSHLSEILQSAHNDHKDYYCDG